MDNFKLFSSFFKFFALLLILNAYHLHSSIRDNSSFKKIELLEKFKKDYKNQKDIVKLKKEVFNLGGKAVPTLIEVMKGQKYPDRSRWTATFLLGRIMGKKSSPFLLNFLEHPNWVLRLASLKTLLILKENNLGTALKKSLKDKSLLVRSQALENIKRLNLKEYSKDVWAMLFDERNYHQGKNKKRKRTQIIKKVIKVLGELQFKEALRPLLALVKNEKYRDIFYEVDYSLQKITGEKSPSKSRVTKMNFWESFSRRKD